MLYSQSKVQWNCHLRRCVRATMDITWRGQRTESVANCRAMTVAPTFFPPDLHVDHGSFARVRSVVYTLTFCSRAPTIPISQFTTRSLDLMRLLLLWPLPKPYTNTYSLLGTYIVCAVAGVASAIRKFMQILAVLCFISPLWRYRSDILSPFS